MENQLEERHCKNPLCNKVLVDVPRNMKYCSPQCRTRYNAVLQYDKVKDDEEFKIKRKEKNKNYYEANKEKLQARMRIYGMEYYFKKKAEKEKQKLEIKKEETNNEEKGDQTISQTINNQ